MKNKRGIKLSMLVLIAVSLVADFPGAQRSIPAAEAAGPPVNAVIAIFNVIGAARRRNRVYREAGATQRDMDAYYDGLLDEARDQLRERELMGEGTLENRGQLRVYIKMYEALKAERE
ncbi:MAG: hypothetical protein MUP44_00965, partial [Anaerolineales bacterium]|nr:hypothetical protein [Anaerolineales bacterium]